MILTMNFILLCVFYCFLLRAFLGQYIDYRKLHCIRDTKIIRDHYQEQTKSIQQNLSSKANRSSANQEIPTIL